jgi:two-component system, NarL family, nitrate/nitrite response regulator NarL
VTIRCVIVDDHQSFLEAASTLLGREGLEIVGVASNSDEALRQVEKLRPDVVLVDVFLGEESGLDLARRLVDDGRPDPGTVILISSHPADDLADLIVGSPADGFITKAELSAAAIRQMVDANGRRDT